MEESILLWCSWWCLYATIQKYISKGACTSGRHAWGRKRAGMVWMTEENYFHAHRGYCLPGMRIQKRISAKVLAACSLQLAERTVWKEEEGTSWRWLI